VLLCAPSVSRVDVKFKTKENNPFVSEFYFTCYNGYEVMNRHNIEGTNICSGLVPLGSELVFCILSQL
jgi:hypothetical protein